MEVRISVRSLVEFILRSGDIDNRKAASPENAMQEGGRIHRMIQRRMGPSYQAEVSLRHVYDAERYEIVVEGRADGIITEEGRVTIDEIKGTYHDLAKMKGPVPVHLAQAKCYAYIYASQNHLEEIGVRMTYVNLDTEELRYFALRYSFQELEEWFLALMREYKKWAQFQYEWRMIRQKSIKEMAFPLSWRTGQKELAEGVYRTILRKKNLFIQAPTGTGKTITTLFPAVKAVGEELSDKIFYLTAKTIA